MIKTDEQIDRQVLCTQLMDSIDMKAFTMLTTRHYRGETKLLFYVRFYICAAD